MLAPGLDGFAVSGDGAFESPALPLLLQNPLAILSWIHLLCRWKWNIPLRCRRIHFWASEAEHEPRALRIEIDAREVWARGFDGGFNRDKLQGIALGFLQLITEVAGGVGIIVEESMAGELKHILK